jgi:hypothetical protein
MPLFRHVHSGSVTLLYADSFEEVAAFTRPVAVRPPASSITVKPGNVVRAIVNAKFTVLYKPEIRPTLPRYLEGLKVARVDFSPGQPLAVYLESAAPVTLSTAAPCLETDVGVEDSCEADATPCPASPLPKIISVQPPMYRGNAPMGAPISDEEKQRRFMESEDEKGIRIIQKDGGLPAPQDFSSRVRDVRADGSVVGGRTDMLR